MSQHTDIAIIGAGPSGAAVSCLLRQKGYKVVIIEKQHFPRFSIGESLLPQCMHFLEEAGLLDTVNDNAERLGFQFKDGARFLCGDKTAFYNFTEKFTEGYGTTWQVRRADFDALLIQEAIKQGVEVRFGHQVVAVNVEGDEPCLTVQGDGDEVYELTTKFLLDASGFGRILPKLLELECPSNFPVRQAIFTHITDNIDAHPNFEREKILITVHKNEPRMWYWLIPFADGQSSFGVVAEPSIFDAFADKYQIKKDDLKGLLLTILADDKALSDVLKNANFEKPINKLHGYSANVKQLYGKNFALLGNAGEFLDPVFSSGVTIALKSASMAAPLVDRVLRGDSVDWQQEFEIPLRKGIAVFRAYVEAWYDGDFQDVVFSTRQNDDIRRMISSLLAGYAWDETNQMNRQSARHLRTLAEYCRERN